MKVWAIFSIENEYYQPDNNLEKLYASPPTKEQLLSFFYSAYYPDIEDIHIKNIERLMSGESIRMHNDYGADYRVEEVDVEVLQ